MIVITSVSSRVWKDNGNISHRCFSLLLICRSGLFSRFGLRSLSGGSLLSLGLFFSFWLLGRAMLVIRGILASEDSSVDAEDGFLASSYQRTFRKWIYLTITWTFSFSPFSFSTSIVILFWPFQP